MTLNSHVNKTTFKINKISFQGNPMYLVGRRLILNKPAPDFTVLNNDMVEVGLAQFVNKIKVITTLASLDTPVCELQVKEFNKSAASFSSDVIVLIVSKDLPFAQKRFCANHEANNLMMLSDYKYSSFGINYGLLIKELNLLARAAIILDRNDNVRYIQVGEELTRHLDYADILKHLGKILKAKPLPKNKDLPGKCVSCESGAPPLPIYKIRSRLHHFSDWLLVEDKKIVKEIKFPDFVTAKYFLDLAAFIAQEQGHHPTFTLTYNKLKITLITHAVDGLTENDFVMARLIDELSINGY